MIPASTLFDQSTIATILNHDPVVSDYRPFFSALDWSAVSRWEARQSSRGRPAHPEAAYVQTEFTQPFKEANASPLSWHDSALARQHIRERSL